MQTKRPGLLKESYFFLTVLITLANKIHYMIHYLKVAIIPLEACEMI